MRITSYPLSRALRLAVVPCLALASTSTFPPVRLAAQTAPRTIDIVASDDMKYDKTTLEAKPGEQIRVRVTAKGTIPKIAMAHNFVLLKVGTDPAAFVAAGVTARPTDFIAPDKKAQVIAATTLAGNGETVEITFKVPTAPGRYPYVCTFPGHFAGGMKGILVVKK